MTIEERFRQEQLEALRRLQWKVTAAIEFIEADIPALADDGDANATTDRPTNCRERLGDGWDRRRERGQKPLRH